MSFGDDDVMSFQVNSITFPCWYGGGGGGGGDFVIMMYAQKICRHIIARKKNIALCVSCFCACMRVFLFVFVQGYKFDYGLCGGVGVHLAQTRTRSYTKALGCTPIFLRKRNVKCECEILDKM